MQWLAHDAAWFPDVSRRVARCAAPPRRRVFAGFESGGAVFVETCSTGARRPRTARACHRTREAHQLERTVTFAHAPRYPLSARSDRRPPRPDRLALRHLLLRASTPVPPGHVCEAAFEYSATQRRLQVSRRARQGFSPESMSARTLLQIDPNSNRLDSSHSSDADSMPATPSKDKFREWTFPRTKAGSGGPALALSSSASTGARPAFASSSKPGAGIRTAVGGSTAARRPSVATRGSSRAAAGEFSHAIPPAPVSSSTSTGAGSSSSEVAHGRSSSVAPNSSPKRQRPLGSTDFRHRSNASLLTSPIASKKRVASKNASSGASLSFVKLNMPAEGAVASTPTPSRFARFAVALVRRRSLGEIIYIVLFSGCIVVWAAALCGYGHAGPLQPSKAELARPSPDAIGAAAVVDVRVPDPLLPQQDRSDPNGEYLADVHQRDGDTSHDEGEDHFQASPLDPALADENAP